MAAAVPFGKASRPSSALQKALSLPPQWLRMYDDFITKNASQVSQIESALRSLTYIIPGRFRDAEIASESIHSSVQLLSLYHDALLLRSLSPPPPLPRPASASASASPKTPTTTTTTTITLPQPQPPLRSSLSLPPSPHSRYTRFWTSRSPAYRRLAYVLQIVSYTELLVEMAAKRRGGERARWRVVVLLEAVKAACRLALLRVTRARPLVAPVLPERPAAMPDDEDDDDDGDEDAEEVRERGEEEEEKEKEARQLPNGDKVIPPEQQQNGEAQLQQNGSAAATHPHKSAHTHTHTSASADREWWMPRTGMSLPKLPSPGDTAGWLATRVLTAEDLKPAPQLVRQAHGGAGRAAEVLHILAPLVFAVASAVYSTRNLSSTTVSSLADKSGVIIIAARDGKRSSSSTPSSLSASSWTPWVLGVAVSLLARYLAERERERQHCHGHGGGAAAAGTTALEREERSRRGWALLWWAMRGAAYERVARPAVGAVKRRVPALVAGILEDYEYLWENYYFSTSL